MSVQASQTVGDTRALSGQLLQHVTGAMASPEQTRVRALDRHANAHDASHFC